MFGSNPYYIEYVLYRLETGEITSAGTITVEVGQLPHIPDGLGVVYGKAAPRDTHFVDLTGEEPVLRERIPLPITINKTTIAADDADEAVLSGFPEGAIVVLDSEEPYIIEGGSITITSPMPARYDLFCAHFPYLDWEATIEAVA